MSDQDVMALVPGRPTHDALALVETMERTRAEVCAAFAVPHRLIPQPATANIPPGASVLRGPFPAGALTSDTPVAGLGNLGD